MFIDPIASCAYLIFNLPVLRRTVAYAVVQTMNSAFDINLDATEERQSAKLVAFRKTVASSGIHSFSDELAAALGKSLSSS
jgi:hypothetical protein